MVRLKSVGVLSAAKVSGLLHAGLSLLLIPIFVLMALAMSFAPKAANEPSPMFFVVFAFFAPFIYGAMGFILGAIGAFVYNLVAGWIGGLELRFETMVPAPVAMPQPQMPQPPAPGTGAPTIQS
ncbi:MAG TPA: hypothetical protein VN577_12585 [Terriglobales bacterium]|nr:hypothetical protein [Terriglobales bacterium]